MAKTTFDQDLLDFVSMVMRLSFHGSMQKAKEFKMSSTQLSALGYLINHEAATVSEISEFLLVSKAASSQMLDKLVQMELVERRDDPRDRRIRHHFVTDLGKKTMKNIRCTGFDWATDLSGKISPEEKKDISRTLTRLTELIGETNPMKEHK